MTGKWWIMKVACGLLLALYLATSVLALVATHRQPLVPVLTAQILAVLGASISLWHYWLLKAASRRLDRPERLVVEGGLFTSIRHPMYLGDLMLFSGLALLTADGVGYALAAAAALATVRQARTEDQILRDRFPAQHAGWRRRTALLIPWPSSIFGHP